jgi:hypothetical protein
VTSSAFFFFPGGQSPDYYLRLEESLKSWKYFLVDKFVYTEQFDGGDHDPLLFVPKQNSNLNRRIDLDITLGGEWEANYSAIIIPARNWDDVRWMFESKVDSSGMGRNTSVLVNVPEPMQLPEFSDLRPISCMIGLKRLDLPNGCSGNSDHLFRKISASVGIVNRHDREAGFRVGCSPVGQGEVTGEMVERSTKAVDEVAQHENNRGSDWIDIERHAVLSSLKVILLPNGIGRAVQKPMNFFLKEAQMVLRPIHLHAGISNSWQSAQ